jgi:hypothetical protein
MYASHLLLGRPWKYDRKVMHDEFKNRTFFFVKDKKSIILISLTPKQVYEHRLKLKKENITENESIYI